MSALLWLSSRDVRLDDSCFFMSGETWWGLWFLTSSFHRPRLTSATVLRCLTLLGGNYQQDMRCTEEGLHSSVAMAYWFTIRLSFVHMIEQTEPNKGDENLSLLVCLGRDSSGQCQNGWWTGMHLGTSWCTQQFAAPFPPRVATQT